MSAAAEKVTGYEETTPNGTRVFFQTHPKRIYKVNDTIVPSVTEILKCLDKPGLPWWGMKTGIGGMIELIHRGYIGRDINGRAIVEINDTYVPATEDNITKLLTEHKLTVNHTLSKAGDRGVNVHAALEAYFGPNGGTLPDPEYYPEEERGYVAGLAKFLTDLKVSARPKVQMETMVGHSLYEFAGRYDLSLNIDECELVTNVTPVRGETREVFPKGRIIADLKTSKGTYDSHHLQLSAYELASVKCGYQATAYQLVVRVGADGNYAVTRNRATGDDFLAVLDTYKVLESLKRRKAA